MVPAGIPILFSWSVITASLSTKTDIYEFIPERLQNPFTFCILWIHENIFTQTRGAVFLMTFCQLLAFLGNISEHLALETASLGRLRNSKCSYEKNFKNVREIQLLVIVFNAGYAPVVYVLKMFSLILAVLSGFFGIRCFSSKFSFASFLLVCFFYYMVFYVATFGRAFSVPSRIQALKTELVRNVRLQAIGRLEGKLAEIQVASIANVGIKVGIFHTMERESTPAFINFVVNTISSLLITFR
ncbi:unnamed protein product [Allacma fusca]|uniref:Uncharacterized protein n=1 Tax=Allacma fusca TaxID=39272 RepID=A0A8J2JME7_9HEXA|nr:unnamed protein product [Allacma fusca]